MYENNKPIISIIIPCYNVVPFLSNDYMIFSVIKENCKDAEIILVNDASIDDTLIKIAEISEQNENIRIINIEKNSGEAVARNAGIDNAKGEYLLIFDQDDRIEPFLLRTLLEAISIYNYPDLIAFSAVMKSGKDIQVLTNNNPHNVLLNQEYIRKKILAANIGMTQSKNNVIRPHWRVMYKRSLLNTYNVRYDSKKRKDEDQCFLNEVLWCADNLLCIDSPAYQWLRRANSATSMYSPMFENFLDNMHRYQSCFGNYYNFNSQERLFFNVNKVLPDCFDFVLCHEEDVGVDKKSEIMKILTNAEVVSWYKKVKDLSGQSAKIQKAIINGNIEKAYRVIDNAYFYKRIRRYVKRVLLSLKLV